MTVPTRPSLCHACQRYQGAGTCDAFPEEIPGPILFNGADHRGPYPGDGGKRFVLDPSKEDDLRAWIDRSLST